MRKRKVSNPLALAVLSLLTEKPMHPYEMSSTLRERAKEESIKLNFGSLYSVVESLRRHELIDVQETVREGRRPERTVYAITDAGREEFVDWESELLSVPVKEYTQFEAALSLVGALPPDEVIRLLDTRRMRLTTEIVSQRAVIDEMSKQGMPYLFAVEADYVLVLRQAELAFVERLLNQMRDGSLEGIDFWREVHDNGGANPESGWETTPLRRVK
ncbi:PadR family transcriptional regulator [Actinophytocola xinjiangensis]|uniref:PadR family transcriptional regulator n=1 Tax=Actinophytocola xinjiangensis TaxID=485602 RepID=A0A7Z1AYK5_9PSEU|nr:PadR family transcriptional regulator [Actinophytocola xinjiangensis]OLF11776.1 PadR family transcriptional regulator [Actinophytocola xinjiangensis]